MKSSLLFFLFLGLAARPAAGQAPQPLTLEECVALADQNYPLVRKYDLLAGAHAVELSDIRKSWLPQVGLGLQATAQNAVPALPGALRGMLEQTGTGLRGIGKVQYKAALEVGQTLWDGGAARARREAEQARAAERQEALDVQRYAVRERVENLFFSALLLDEQIRLLGETLGLLEADLARVRAMLAHGTALQSDADMVEAQCLGLRQQLAGAESGARSCRRQLGLFTGRDLGGRTLQRPSAQRPAELAPQRPELALFEARLATQRALGAGVRAATMPRVGLFAQAGYGYPGYDYFRSMTERRSAASLLAGVKVTWNLGAFYTRRNSLSRLALAADDAAADREVFLFNTRLQTRAQNSRIDELEEIIRHDRRIVALRADVRRAAEAQLAGGVIDATALLAKITDESQARLNMAYHEIQLIQSIYQLKYTLNR